MTTKINPLSKVRLLSSVPLDKSYTNTMSHDYDLNKQESYFLNFIHLEFENIMPIKKQENTIRVQANVETLYMYNYLMFKNENFGNKWFYAFINEHNYISPTVTEIVYEIDVMQTWMKEYWFKPSFIVNEHCAQLNGDEPMLNTIPENLEIGTEYVTYFDAKIRPTHEDIRFMLIVTTELVTNTNSAHKMFQGIKVGNISDPLNYYLFPVGVNGKTATVNGNSISVFASMITNLYSEENASKVVSMFYIPFLSIPHMISQSADGKILNIISDRLVGETVIGAESESSLQRILSHDILETQYVLSSNRYASLFPDFAESKMYTYPYSFLELYDNQGNVVTLKNEYFNKGKKELRLNFIGLTNTTPKFVTQIMNYKNNKDGHTFDNALISSTVGDVPVINEYISTYMQGNRNSLINGGGMSVVGAGATIGMGIAMASNPATAMIGIGMATQGVVSGASAISSVLSKQMDIENVPKNISQQAINGIFNYATGYENVGIRVKTISEEYQQQLNSYWKAYGYKVNKFKTPNLTTRKAFNFVQSIRPTILGTLPRKDLEIIISNFERGITLWHTTDVGNYNLPNGERS